MVVSVASPAAYRGRATPQHLLEYAGRGQTVTLKGRLPLPTIVTPRSSESAQREAIFQLVIDSALTYQCSCTTTSRANARHSYFAEGHDR
jgi:hypothetical protein